MEYKIIITRDRKQCRCLGKFKNKSNAIHQYINLRKENDKVKFEKRFVNYLPTIFHIELLSPIKFSDTIEYEKDNLGRNIPAPDRKELFIFRLKPWKEPENFAIYGIPGRHEYDFLIRLIKNTEDLISLSTIQNFLILDIDAKPIIVILKNVADAKRLYNTIKDEYLKNVLLFGNMSKENRKVFYRKAEKLDIPVKMFYSKSTRW